MRRRDLPSAIVLFAVGLFSTGSSATEVFICSADLATGFAYDPSTKQWRIAAFKATEKLVLARASPAERKDGFEWVVKLVGSERREFVCDSDFTAHGHLSCRGFGEFKFNRNTLRFFSSYSVGFVVDEPTPRSAFVAEGANTPMMQIGQCAIPKAG